MRVGFAFAICLSPWLLLGCSHPSPTLASADQARASTGMSLAQTLALVRQGSIAGQHRWVSSESLLRVDRDPWQRLDPDRGPFAGQVALIVHVWCRREFDGRDYEGRAVSWYLLRDGAVSAMDHYDFGSRCSLQNEYRPAAAEQVALERELVTRHLRKPAELSAFQLYDRGLALLGVERADEARELLERADRLSGGADSFARQRLLEALQRADADR